MRTWLVRVGLGLVLLLLAAAAVPAWQVGRLLRDDYRLDGIVVAVALDWRDFGKEKAQERLQYDLDHLRLGVVQDEHCALTDEEAGVKSVGCAWSVTLELPFVGTPVPLAFESAARVDRNGVLVR